jgi:hypothetical protein
MPKRNALCQLPTWRTRAIIPLACRTLRDEETRGESVSLSLYFLPVCIVLIRVPHPPSRRQRCCFCFSQTLFSNPLHSTPPPSFPFNLFSPLLLVSPSGYEIVNDNVKIHLYFCLLSRKIREKVGSQRTDALFSIHGSIFVRKPFDCVPTHLI